MELPQSLTTIFNHESRGKRENDDEEEEEKKGEEEEEEDKPSLNLDSRFATDYSDSSGSLQEKT